MHSGDDAYHTFAVYNRLVDVDDNFNVLPELATEWSVSADGLTWTFKLREGVKFHSGKDFSSADVVYTFKRLLRREDSAPAPRRCSSSSIRTASRRPTPRTVTFTTKKPVVELPVLITNKFTNIVPDGAKQARPAAQGRRHRALHAGAVHAERAGAHPAQEPELLGCRQAEGRLPADHRCAGSGRGRSAIKSGQVDLVLNVDPSVIPTLKDDPNVTAAGDRRVELDDDLDVGRHAALRQPQGAPGAEGWWSTARRWSTRCCSASAKPAPTIRCRSSSPASFTKEAPKQDIEKAKELLAEAGHPDGLKFDLYTAEGVPGMVRMAQVYRRDGEAGRHRHQRDRDPGRKLLGRCLAEEADRDLGLVDAAAGRGPRGRLYAERQVEGDPLGAAGL